MTGIGPLDPWLARDLARTSAASPKTTWCLTVTDDKGHAIGHGCARPERGKPPRGRCGQRGAGPPGGHDPPAEPGFTFTPADADGPPGGYAGSWRFSTGIRGQPAQLIMIDPIAIDTCDHRFAAASTTTPGSKLRHLSQVRHQPSVPDPCAGCPSVRADFLSTNTPYDQGGLSFACVTADQSVGTSTGLQARSPLDGRTAHPRHVPVDHALYGLPYLTEPTRYPI